jgi:hypothetical protein
MTSFSADVLPLFKTEQINCMSNQGVFLDDYGYMSDAASDPIYPDHANARHVYARLQGSEGRRMPPNGPYWTGEMLARFKSWMDGEFQP